MSREILLYYTTNLQKTKRRLLKFHDSIKRSGEGFDFAVISFISDATEQTIEHDIDGRKIRQYVYGKDAIPSLGYPQKGSTKPFRLIPGNTDLCVLLFWRAHPDYGRYWVMEDDVEYSGDPALLFTNLRKIDGDLLATHLAKWFPEWDYSSNFKSGSIVLAPDDLWLCFLPFFAIKPASLSIIDQRYKEGWDGHNEMTWATILKHSKCQIVDIGGSGPYVALENRNKYYLGGGQPKFAKGGSFGTLNIRLFPGSAHNILWHPVKPFRVWIKQNLKRLRSMMEWSVKNNSLLTSLKSSPHKHS